MLNCKTVVKKISSDEKVSWMHRLEIKLHLIMCHHCGKYAKQLKLLTLGLKKALSMPSSINVQKIEEQVIQKVKNSSNSKE